jgi:hypothetical protein
MYYHEHEVMALFLFDFYSSYITLKREQKGPHNLPHRHNHNLVGLVGQHL